MKVTAFCLLGIGFYAILNVADFVLTFALIDPSDGMAYESNPLAAACLEQHGWAGLALFKFAGVFAFVAAVGILTVRRPKIAAGLVCYGCIVLIGVTTYSHHLLCEARSDLAQRDAAWGPRKADSNRDILVAWIPTR